VAKRKPGPSGPGEESDRPVETISRLLSAGTSRLGAACLVAAVAAKERPAQ
jgi:hypothetical protein